ncbi:MAG: succinate dehydrogenase, hydrophobic membrane anchor protein [Pseudomonadales bacterium]|nr:succinate dehydrogenase, hydrophobic membrane anchor protein [Pseudomonadales bacterium]
MRTPLSGVRGLGSAKEGVAHWRAQRLTAIALVPLALWFVISMISMVNSDYQTVVAWMGSPLVAAMLVALIVAAFHHAQLGVQVVIEDYVHNEGIKLASLALAKLVIALLGIICAVAVLRVGLGN